MESTYSTLSEPYFSALSDAANDNSSDLFQAESARYRSLLRSLKLQHEARQADIANLDEMITAAESHIAPLQEEVDQQRAELLDLRATSDEQHRIMKLARDCFSRRQEVEIGTNDTALVTLNKPVPLLEEECQKLEQEVVRLNEELADTQSLYDREMDKIVENMISTASEMREKLASIQDERPKIPGDEETQSEGDAEKVHV